MGKTCPKCGEYVSCKKWMYLTKMCRKCDYKYRGSKMAKERQLKKKNSREGT
jgi:DNA-directed RNA polymerase subunit M/transcription elongation factor TFIIS